MKTRKIFPVLLTLILAFSLFACNQQTSKNTSDTEKEDEFTEPSAFFTIDFAEIIKHKRDVNLSEIAKSVEFIPLENNQESMLGNIMDVKLTPEYIFIKHTGSPLLTQFDQNGKFIRHIGTEGRGPKEYGLMRIFSLDEKHRLIYIQTNWTRKILVYNFEGEYIKTIRYPAVERLHNVWARDSFMMSYGSPYSGNDLYTFLETSLSGDTTQTIANHIFWDKKEDRSVSNSYWGRNEFYWVENKLHMKGWYNDTVYTYNNENKIVPKFLVDLKEHKIPDDLIPERMPTKPLPKECYWVGINESCDYIFIRYGLHELRKLGEGENGCIVFTKKSREGVAIKNHGEEYGFINDLNGGPDFQPRYSNDSLIFIDVTALEMKRYLDSDKFKNQEVKFPEHKEKLLELSKTLKEDGNSLLMIARLKNENAHSQKKPL
ncbi:MAG: 6-bladed beta-propeller [Prolixibacteraceae bacterium]|nr:6-bladed beta-propeller [Prolixibacteraceae bacterium]